MTTVLIAVDGTDESVEAARRARELFGADAEYLAINVIESELPPAGPGADWQANWGVAYPVRWGAVWPVDTFAGEPGDPAAVRTLAAEAAAADVAERTTERAGLGAAEVIGEVGDPADAILDAAAQHHASVIVVGSHQRNWLSRLLTPSVSAKVVKQADVPVLVAK